eukprot:531006_1
MNVWNNNSRTKYVFNGKVYNTQHDQIQNIKQSSYHKASNAVPQRTQASHNQNEIPLPNHISSQENDKQMHFQNSNIEFNGDVLNGCSIDKLVINVHQNDNGSRCA